MGQSRQRGYERVAALGKMKKIVIIILGWMQVLTMWGADTIISVAPGNDGAIEDALRAAREFRRRHVSDVDYMQHVFSPDVRTTIVLQGGIHRLYQPLTVRAEDSFVDIRGEKGAVISGAVRITNWKKQGSMYVAELPDVNGRPLDSRQLWVNGRKAVRARNVVDFEDMQRIVSVDKKRGLIWVTKEAIAPLVDARELRAVKDSGWVNLNAGSRYAEMVLHQMWEVSVLRLQRIFVQGDSAALQFCNPERRIQFSRPWPSPMYNSKHDSPYYFTNSLTLLDKPGEWYADARTHLIYYMPREDENMNDVIAEMPALETLVNVLGTPERPVQGVRFSNIGFQHTSWLRPSTHGHVPLQAGMYIMEGYKLRPKIDRPNNHKLDNQDWLGRASAAVQLYGADNVRFENCEFRHLGGSGIDYQEFCHGGGIYDCTLSDIAWNGAVFGSFSPAGLETHLPYLPMDRRAICSGQVVNNSRFTDIGNEEWGCLAIAAGYVKDMKIEHNEISDVPYSGISVGWGWNRDSVGLGNNLVRANYIHHYARHMYDCAGIYTLGNQPGTLITENVVDQIYKPSYVHDPKHWFYLYTDEGSSHITVSNNWTPSDKYLQNANGPGNVWKNNGPQVSEQIKRQAGIKK